jgi:hypothetical protein
VKVRRPTVVVEVETRQAHKRVWINVGRWSVLYFDRDVIVVKQFGTVSLYDSSGQADLAGFKPDHQKAAMIPARQYGWRLSADSVAALKSRRRTRSI